MEIYDTRYFKINKMMLVYIGLWPYANRKKKIYLRCYYISIVLIMTVPQIIGLHLNYQDKDRWLEHIAVLLYILVIFLKIFTAILSEAKLRTMYDDITKNWKLIQDENERNILVEYTEKGRVLTIAYISYIIGAAIGFVSLPLLPAMLDVMNPLNISRPYIFVLNGEFVVDRHDNFGKIYAFDLLTILVTCLIVLAVDTMYAACIEHSLGLFAVVKNRLLKPNKLMCNANYFEKHDEKSAYQWIVGIIQLHTKILKFTNTIEASYSKSFLAIMGVNMVYFSLLAVLVLIQFRNPINFIRYAALLVGLMIHLFYLSWPGQKLIDHSSSLFNDAYLNEWYESSEGSKKLLKFFRLRCSEPCLITAGGLYTMNFENFLSVMKTSVSYITVFASFR